MPKFVVEIKMVAKNCLAVDYILDTLGNIIKNEGEFEIYVTRRVVEK